MEANLRSVPAERGEEGVLTDDASFEEFYEANVRRVFTALCLVTGIATRPRRRPGSVRPCVRAMELGVGTLEDPTGYVFRVSMNVFRNRLRRVSLGLRRAMSLAPHLTDDLAAVETRDEVVRLLRELDPQQRAAVVLTAILDYSADEAGALLGLRASSVRPSPRALAPG